MLSLPAALPPVHTSPTPGFVIYAAILGAYFGGGHLRQPPSSTVPGGDVRHLRSWQAPDLDMGISGPNLETTSGMDCGYVVYLAITVHIRIYGHPIIVNQGHRIPGSRIQPPPPARYLQGELIIARIPDIRPHDNARQSM